MKRGLVTALVAAVLLLGSLVLMAGGALAYAWAQQNPILVAGVSAAEKTQADGEDVREAELGIVIIAVEPDSPAAKAGVVRGDILLRVNGSETNSLRDLFRALDSLAAGEEVNLELTHGDEARTLTATLDERGERSFLGIHGVGGGEMIMAHHTIFVGEGALIAEVQDNSPALAAGLTSGEIILSVDGEKLTPGTRLPDLIAARAPGDSVTLEVRNRAGETREVTVTLGKKPDVEEDTAYLGVKLAPVGMRHFGMHGGPAMGAMPFGPGGPPMWEMPFEGMPFGEPLELPEGVTEAVIVAEMMKDGPAAKAGLERNDLIVALDGKAISSPEEIRAAIQAKEPGDSVMLTIRRGDAEPTDIEVTLGESEAGDAHLGIGLGHIKRIEGEGGLEEQMDFFVPALPALPGGMEGEMFELPLPPGFPGGEGQEDFFLPAQPVESQAI